MARMTDNTLERQRSGSCDLFNFPEITDNISETVQDKDTVTMEE